MNKYNWNKQELEKLILVDNMSYEDIAKLYGAGNGSTVRNAAIRLGIDISNKVDIHSINFKYRKEDLEHYIFYEGLTIKEISKIYKVSISTIEKAINRYNIILPNYKIYVPLKYKSSNYNEDGTINNNYLPVPLKYTYPVCMKIRILWKGNDYSKDLLYIPEEGKWFQRRSLLVRTRIGRFDKAIWFNRWVIKAKDPENLTEEDVDRIIQIKYDNKLPHTKEYIKNQLLINCRYECDFYCTKEDLIESYFQSRSEEGQYQFNYGFEKVPQFIRTGVEKFTITYSETLNNGERVFGKFITTFLDLIFYKRDAPILASGIKHSSRMRMTNEDFLIKAREVHGDLYEYIDDVNDRNENDTIRIRCKRCGRIFRQNPRVHLQGRGCRSCNSKYRDKSNLGRKTIPFEEFVERSREIHGNRYEYFEDSYVDMKSKTKIRDTVTGDIFYQTPDIHLRGSGNPNLFESHGESYVDRWLKENYPDLYERTPTIKGIEGRLLNFIRPDFILKVNGIEFWIEYHGKQHYIEMPFFHKTHEDFLKQLKRDQNERDYCKENGIILLEISYEYNTYEKVVNFLEEHIKNVL